MQGRESAMAAQNGSYLCKSCQKIYPIVDSILFFFPYEQFEKLYPDIFKSIHGISDRNSI
jgi:phosphate starvation-inducible membrane PsiE